MNTPTQNAKPSLENLDALINRRVLSVRERQSLGQAMSVYGYPELASKNGYIPGSSGAAPVEVPWLNVKRPQLNAQQKQVRETLEKGTPEPLSAKEKDELKRLAEHLKEGFTNPEWFQTRREIRAVSHRDPDFHSGLEKASKWQKPQEKLGGKTPQQYEQAYKNVMRLLEPESDTCDDVEHLRQAK